MIHEFIDYLKHVRRFSVNTVVSYENDLSQFLNYLNERFSICDLSTVTSKQVRLWIISLLELKYNKSSVNRKIASLKSFYKYLFKTQNLSINPTKFIKPLERDKIVPRFIDKEKLIYFLNNYEFKKDFVSTRDKLILELLFCTGMRLSELLKLKMSDIDLVNSSLKVIGKGNKQRIIPCPLELIDLIKDYSNQKKNYFNIISNDFLVCTNEGHPAYPMLVYRTVTKYIGLISNNNKKSPHILRHTFATHFLNNGADLNAIKLILGHKNLSSTQVYTHVSIKNQKEVYKKSHPRA